MFSDAPLSATPLASGGGPTWVASVLDGAAGADTARIAATLLGSVLVAGGAAGTQSARASFSGAAVEGASGGDVSSTRQTFVIKAVEAPASNVAMGASAGAFLIQTVDGATGADYHPAQMVLDGVVVEDSAPVDLVGMTQLWEFIGTGVSAGWQAIPTGTPNAWILIKTRNS